MATQNFAIKFDGYWRDSNKGGVPAKSGVYCVYSCVYNANEKTVTINKLIYIGESENVQTRIANHEKQPDWEKLVKAGEQLCFTFGAVDSNVRIRCEAAMINKHKPPVNTEYVDTFPFDQTTMDLSGKIELLNSLFTVYRKEN